MPMVKIVEGDLLVELALAVASLYPPLWLILYQMTNKTRGLRL